MSEELYMTEQVVESVLDSGNTAWIVVATILVLMMTIPGLALFYGGLVRRKNILSVLMQCLILTAVIIIEWVIIGYSLAFTSSGGSANLFIGGFDKIFLSAVGVNDILEGYSIPELLFVSFQGMFAVITPALIIGAFAERIKFKGFILFSVFWALLVYNPLAHWVWGGGWIGELGAIDFAGGTVVHINAGVSALMMAVLLGRRKGWNTPGEAPITPHNIPFVVIGTALLWMGWLGFNGGSGLAADGISANAILVTNLAAAAAALTWSLLDQIINKKPTVVGFCTGVIAGLVAITPAAGSTGVFGGIVIGVASGLICFWMVAHVKFRFGYDDSLDAFGVHGVGGIIGSILIGVFATQEITGEGGAKGALYGDWNQLWIQFIATVATIAFSALMTWVLFNLVDKLVGIRVSEIEESIGLDISEHGEIAYE
ncbi:ammonium transporter [Lascolabacillus sp.]|jgi:Amt family ammonium transporter|uniref:ammonium transporter n=1 Tax=Lascolabacillus sp. TaxID=1924068 RepID=UPI000ADB48EB|nr:ammonium transporter [Lascolabacillus sp.]MDD2606490.1 ammonium transporter [Lascolabacillus sp.]MDD3657931.1 ammonium transporter [Lascolabacillus sp.]MDD4757687.1 ammonium transporter [Lascolabacillus sp.]